MERRDDAEMTLGPLEAQIMEILWSGGPATPAAVKAALEPERPLAYTTVMTVLSRLYDKGLLSRRKTGRAFEYEPRTSKTEMLSEKASKALRALSGVDAQPPLSFFVDAAANLDDEQLARLEEEIARLRETRS